MERFYYHDSIETFLAEDESSIFGKLSQCESFDTARDQKNAWVDEIRILKEILPGKTGDIIFEYSIPRLGKRVDVVLVIGGIVFCLEFKAGADRYEAQDREQVWDYALDLKNFHQPSHDLTIVPILVATDAPDAKLILSTSVNYDDHVYEPIECNALTLKAAIKDVLALGNFGGIDGLTWARGRYSPTPTIIQAASALYTNHNVADITRCDAGDNLQKTTDFVLGVIDHAKANKEKSICFVTGVPGAGKTLVGLNVAMKQFEKLEPAVYLTGNGPLVEVLTEALAQDKVKRAKKRGERILKTVATREVKSFIQIIHHYRDNTLAKLRQPILDGHLEIDPDKAQKVKDDGFSEVEHVAIFDEAQRLWDQPHLSSWLARKKGINGFPMSESEFLIWSLDLREDWAVVVCLVGGGQEINSGEAGIAEPIRAVNERFRNWNVFISPQLTAKEYAEGHLDELLEKNQRVTRNAYLHLATSIRSIRAEKLSLFVHQLLDREDDAAKSTYREITDQGYPIVLTRDINKAKAWLRTKARGSERYGMICSSQAFRLRPLAIDVRAKPDTVHWFLDDVTDIRSSLFLEDVSTEFDIQGLELDWSCVVWDGDFRYGPYGWIHKDFNGGKWKNINAPERQSYQKNAYRVLLTRARWGMVICVPEGNRDDDTRRPEFYDCTYDYLNSLDLMTI